MVVRNVNIMLWILSYTNIFSRIFLILIFTNSEFGGKVFSLKPIVKVLPKLFDHSDKTVREEVCQLLMMSVWRKMLVEPTGLALLKLTWFL